MQKFLLDLIVFARGVSLKTHAKRVAGLADTEQKELIVAPAIPFSPLDVTTETAEAAFLSALINSKFIIDFNALPFQINLQIF